MRKVFLLICLFGLLTAARASAAIVACPVATTADVLTSFNSLSNACFSQDTLFWGFTYTPGGNAPAASAVVADLISQQVSGIAIHGWNFGSTWSQASTGTLANFVLSFMMEVCPTSGQPCSGNTVPGTAIIGADATYAPSAFSGAGNEEVDWSNGATVTLASGSAGPLPGNANIGLPPGFTGPIQVTANFDGHGTITQTSLRFYDSTSPVPEPATYGLAGLGLLAVVLVHRKFKVNRSTAE